MWTLRDMAGAPLASTFDVVVFTHDSNPRSVRKASMVQVLESGLPATGNVTQARMK